LNGEVKQGSHRSGRVKFKDFSRSFKAMYPRQFKDCRAEKKALEISKK
jgi:hypothetical protein